MDLTKYAEKKKQQIDKVRKEVAVKAYSQIVQKTPVDTGRARGNWQIGINFCPQDELERIGDNSQEELPKIDRCKADETIYISNNLPYINCLEYGSSKQAPQGMVGVTMASINNTIARAIQESK